MLVRPASLRDTRLLLNWADTDEMNLSAVLPETQRWRGDRRRLKRTLAGADQKLLIALQAGVEFGVIAIIKGVELRWAVCPEHRGKGYGKRMVRLAVDPHHIAYISQDDLASQRIAAFSGFDLVEEGTVQTWLASRAPRYS